MLQSYYYAVSDFSVGGRWVPTGAQWGSRRGQGPSTPTLNRKRARWGERQLRCPWGEEGAGPWPLAQPWRPLQRLLLPPARLLLCPHVHQPEPSPWPGHQAAAVPSLFSCGKHDLSAPESNTATWPHSRPLVRFSQHPVVGLFLQRPLTQDRGCPKAGPAPVSTSRAHPTQPCSQRRGINSVSHRNLPQPPSKESAGHVFLTQRGVADTNHMAHKPVRVPWEAETGRQRTGCARGQAALQGPRPEAAEAKG